MWGQTQRDNLNNTKIEHHPNSMKLDHHKLKDKELRNGRAVIVKSLTSNHRPEWPNKSLGNHAGWIVGCTGCIFPLGFSSLANHPWRLAHLLIFYLPTNNLVTLTRVLLSPCKNQCLAVLRMRAADSHGLSNWVYIPTYLLVINFLKNRFWY